MPSVFLSISWIMKILSFCVSLLIGNIGAYTHKPPIATSANVVSHKFKQFPTLFRITDCRLYKMFNFAYSEIQNIVVACMTTNKKTT